MPYAMFLAAAAGTVALGWLVIWSRLAFRPRLCAVLLAVAMICGVGIGFADSLGRPKPTRLEAVRTPDVDVLGSRIVEGSAIYLWLGLPGEEAPRAYVLPWNMELAKQLQAAMEEIARNGGALKGSNLFERSWDRREPKFYPNPIQKLPDKPTPPPPVVIEQGA